MTKVLVVDDDKEILEVVSIILKLNNCDVVCLDTADSVLENLQILQPNIVLLNGHIQGVDGRIVCKEIKETGLYLKTTFILFTADHQHATDAKKYLFDD
ncbi:hypothetical protein BH11BAC6_BH11BAC6_05630 [soil metagenome]